MMKGHIAILFCHSLVVDLQTLMCTKGQVMRSCKIEQNLMPLKTGFRLYQDRIYNAGLSGLSI